MARCSSASATPVPVREPFAAMLTELAANREHEHGRQSRLPVAGRAGQPLTPGALGRQFCALGVVATQTRTAAFRQLLLQGRPGRRHALGYSPGTATCHVIAADGTWYRHPATRAGS